MVDEPLAIDGRPIGDRAENGDTRGLAGAIRRARSTAPEDATEGDIHDVAFAVWMQDLEAADVWREVSDGS